MNILIVEDDPVIRQELKMLLENSLYHAEALEQFDRVDALILERDPDLVLLDLNLPQESGFVVCTKVRAESDVPIIFLTSRTDSADELNGMLKGGDDYITKPFHPPVLLARIAAAVLKRTKRGSETQVSVLRNRCISGRRKRNRGGFKVPGGELLCERRGSVMSGIDFS